MNAMRILLVAGLFICGAVYSPARAETGREIQGELVVLKGSTHQFRIVEHPGTFTAPPGTPLEQLDGKNVRVELSSNGRVASIQEVPVPINPVEHGLSSVRGELVVTDAINRRFTVSGDNQVYTAPPNVDIAAYSGKMVEFKVDQNGRVADLRLVSSAPASSYGSPPYGAYAPPPPTNTCTYGGETYSAGAAVCQSGMQYRCDGSQWRSLGTTCQPPDIRDAKLPPSPPRPCIVGGATVASGSGICREGTTYRCDDGTWINAQTACR